ADGEPRVTALVPELTVWFAPAWTKTGVCGAALTVRVAAMVVAEPAVLVKTARNSLPVWPVAAVKEEVVDVGAGMLLQEGPTLVLSCHCTVGVGVPLATAVKLAV